MEKECVPVRGEEEGEKDYLCVQLVAIASLHRSEACRLFIRSGQEDKKFMWSYLPSSACWSTVVSGPFHHCYSFSSVRCMINTSSRLNRWDLQLRMKGQCWNAIQDKYKQHRCKDLSALLPPVVISHSYF